MIRNTAMLRSALVGVFAFTAGIATAVVLASPASRPGSVETGQLSARFDALETALSDLGRTLERRAFAPESQL